MSSAYDAVGIAVEEAPEPPPVDVAADPGEQWVATVAAELDGDNSLRLVKPISNSLEGRDGWEDILQLTTTQVFAGTGRAITAPVNGEFLMFVDSDNNLRYISADGTGEEVINADGDWHSIALSPDGLRLVATATYDEPVIHYFDFDSEDTYHQIELYQPTTQEGIHQDIVRYADVLQWDATGTYVIYDAFNSLPGPAGVTIDFWTVNALDVASATIWPIFASQPKGVQLTNPSLSSAIRPDGTIKMYWTDGGDTDRIKRSSLDGSGVEDLVTSGLDEPEGLALDVAGGKMYWADGGSSGDRARGKIQRSNLDGSGVEDLVTTGFWHPVGIALDVAGGKMYWTHSRAKIQRSNLDGSGVEDLFTGLAWPLGIALGFVPVDVEAGTDLAVEASVRDTRLTPGQWFQLSVTVQNRGSEQAAATTLRYYRSDDATIDATDTQLGTAAVDSLATLAPRAYRIDLTAPESTGTYYYGACVESVSGESKIDNNCSSAVTVTVGQASGNYGVGESLPNFPSGSFFPRLLSGASFRSSGGLVVLNFNNGGVIELQDNTTYTCIASDGCSVENGRVTSGTIRVTTGDGDDG